MNNRPLDIPFLLACAPVVFLLTTLLCTLALCGADSVQVHGWKILMGSGIFAAVIAVASRTVNTRRLRAGIWRSVSQLAPTLPILLLIATLSATWMFSGVVPYLIDAGLHRLNPRWFLMLTCIICAAVSVVTGSSWTTIATVGVAFMGIGGAMGHSPGWIAGAIISGAYFGDKVSPLSDTTVLASSACGVNLMEHIRFMMHTTIPAMILALAVFAVAGWTITATSQSHTFEIEHAIRATFNLTPWLIAVPALTALLIALRVRTLIVLAVGTLSGLVALLLFQPGVLALLAADTSSLSAIVRLLISETTISTGSAMLDALVSTGGIAGMMPTIALIVGAMMFGGIMMGTGFLQRLTRAITSRLSGPRSLTGAAVGTGLFLNTCTGDQYISIIIGGNVYRPAYRRLGIQPRILSRTVEDSTSVTSVLIPWNSCGITQATVLGVATLTYLPYCIFNIASPLMTLLIMRVGRGCGTWLAPRHTAPVTTR